MAIDAPLQFQSITAQITVTKHTSGGAEHIETVELPPQELEGTLARSLIGALIANPDVRAQLIAQRDQQANPQS